MTYSLTEKSYIGQVVTGAAVYKGSPGSNKITGLRTQYKQRLLSRDQALGFPELLSSCVTLKRLLGLLKPQFLCRMAMEKCLVGSPIQGAIVAHSAEASASSIFCPSCIRCPFVHRTNGLHICGNVIRLKDVFSFF